MLCTGVSKIAQQADQTLPILVTLFITIILLLLLQHAAAACCCCCCCAVVFFTLVSVLANQVVVVVLVFPQSRILFVPVVIVRSICTYI